MLICYMSASHHAVIVKWQKIKFQCIMVKRMILGVLQNKLDRLGGEK